MAKFLLTAVFCSTDRFGSRFIQDNIATATPDEKAMVFVEIIPHVAELVIDAFANYVVQKAIEVGDLDQKIRIAEELDGNIIMCIDDQNANHVVQKCIECMPQEHVLFIYQNIYGHVVELSAHQYGCRVIQRVLEYCNHPSIQKNILSEIMEQIYWLAKDQYGNYVVQHLLQHGARPLRSAIIKTFAGRVVGMSRGKCSSNVIEKCLIHGDYEEKQLIINEVFSSGGEPDALTVMVGDPFANYVVQKVMETCDDWQRQMILRRLKTYLGELSSNAYGRHIVAPLMKLIQTGGKRTSVRSQLIDSCGKLETRPRQLAVTEQTKFRPLSHLLVPVRQARNIGHDAEVLEPD
ncbi:hypothetical protein EJB05_00918, partial [Eragrostis curvula]